MEIPDIGAGNIQIRKLDIPPVMDIFNSAPTPIPYAAPVVVNIGIPIVDVPGCVEAHEAKNKNNNLIQDDPRGILTFCDGNLPSFNPINFEPNQSLPTPAPKIDTRQSDKPDPEIINAIPPAAPPATANIQCPTASQQAKEPVGTYLEGFRKKVTGYELIGNECVQLTEKVPLPEQVIAGLPQPGSVVATGSIAVIATTSALLAKPLADFLLKVVKPTVKKVMKKIATVRGKKIPVLSASERREEQRLRNQAIKTLRSVRPLKK
jgi:hypothetical protein